MQGLKLAIKVARIADGWAWALVDGEGAPMAAGVAPAQLAAMEIAWRTARAFAPANDPSYPEIIVEQSWSRGVPFSAAAS